jgi:hypothetical protein
MTKAINHRALKKPGRKPLDPPQDAALRIEELAADGFSKIGIAKRMGTCVDVLNKWLEISELQEAFDNGRENERWALHNMLFRAAMEKGNITAAAIILNARHGYRQDDRAQIANKVSVNVNADMLTELAKLLPN